MFLMSASMVFCCSFVLCDSSRFQKKRPCHDKLSPMFSLACRRSGRLLWLVPNAKKGNSRKRTWWQQLFSDIDSDSWFGLNEEDVLGDLKDSGGETREEEPSEEEKFEAWRRRAEAISDLREAQGDATSAGSREWEDWLGETSSDVSCSSWDEDLSGVETAGENSNDLSDLMPDKGFVGAVRDLFLRNNDDDLLFEDRVFRFASMNSVKFLAILVLIPWVLDFVVHDYVLMPFLDRYVKTVPLAAEMLDVRRHQKLEMVKALKVERARFRFEVEIGKAPPLSDEEVWLELRHKAIELRDEWRLENRRAFANILSDMVYGIALFILICFNQSKVALLKFTGYKLLNNISDTGKAFLIILITDIFLGYHSESGWQALIETILERYGLEVDQAAITIFICFVPVVIDACVKLWLFKFLPRLSPNVANIFREMKRH